MRRAVRYAEREANAQRNVDHLRVQSRPALRWMGDRTHPPKARDAMILGGGSRLGKFWTICKSRKRCARSPYDQLLTNPVLRADYRTHTAARESDCKA